MAAVTLAVPIVNGMTEHWKQAVAELTGPRAPSTRPPGSAPG